jgi:hypothetical protein
VLLPFFAHVRSSCYAVGVKGVVSTINYCVSWKNPVSCLFCVIEKSRSLVFALVPLTPPSPQLMTMLCLLIFVYSCIKFNPEYVGSIPFSCILLYMVNKARIRRFGMFKRYWVEKERDARLEVQ